MAHHNNIEFPAVAFDYSTRLGVPSPDEFRRLRDLREVSHGFRDSVDIRLRDEEWKHTFNLRAHAFVHGAPPDPNAPVLPVRLTVVEKLIDAKQYILLTNGMCEFVMHEETQRFILAALRTALSVPAPQNPDAFESDRESENEKDRQKEREKQKYINIFAASNDGIVHRAVARSIRFHLDNAIIVRDGSYVLSILTHPTGMTQALVDYITTTLIAVIYNRTTDLQVGCFALQAILTLVSVGRGFQTISFGSHNILDVLCRCLHEFPNVVRLNEMCITMMNAFCCSIRTGRDDAAMQLFSDQAAEGLLHRCMRRYRTNLQICTNALSVLTSLNVKRKGRKCMHAATAEAVRDLLVSHMMVSQSVYVAIMALKQVMLSLVEPVAGVGGSTIPPPRTDAPVITNAASIIPLAVAAVRIMKCNSFGKTTCANLLHLLILLCQYDASNIAHIVNCNAMQVLVERFEATPMIGVEAWVSLDVEWQSYRTHLEILVRAGVDLQ